MKIKKKLKKEKVRSQIIKNCKFIEKNKAIIEIISSILLNESTYDYLGLQKDIFDFVQEINKELKNICMNFVTEQNIIFEIQKQKGLLNFVFRQKRLINQQQLYKLKNHEWIIQ